MASNVAYQIRGVPGEAEVFPLGSAAAPSILFGDPNALGGLNDGFYGTSTPAIGLAVNGTSVATWTSAGLATGAIATTGGITSSSPTAGLGYATGAGGAITQGTSKTQGVTLNTVTGQITMNGAALGSGAIATFVVTDSAVANGDVVVVNHGSAGTAGAYHVDANTITAGAFSVTVHNFSGSSLSEAIVLHFAVVKSVAA